MACLGIFAPYTYLKSIRVKASWSIQRKLASNTPNELPVGGELCTKSLEAAVEIGGSCNRMVPASTASLAFALSATHRKGIEDFAGVAQGPQASAPRIVRRGGGG